MAGMKQTSEHLKYRVRNAFRNLSISRKLMMFYVPMMLAAVTVCLMQFGSAIKNNALEEVCKSRVDLLKNVSDKITGINQTVISVSNSYLFDNNVRSFLRYSEDESVPEHNQRYRRVQDSVTQQHNVFLTVPFHTTIYGFAADAYVTNSQYGTKERDTERVTEYQKLLGEQYTRLVWTGISQIEGTAFLSAVRYVMDVDTGQPVGMMIFDFEEALWAEAYEEYLNEGEVISVVDEDGDILSSSEKKKVGSNIAEQTVFGEIIGFSEGYFTDSSQDAMVCFMKNPDLSWYMVSETKQSGLVTYYSIMFRYLFYFCLVLGGIFFIVTVLITYYISSPIQKLIGKMKAYHSDVGQAVENSGQNSTESLGDEVLYLKYEYENMIDRINHLLEQIEREQAEKRTYELKALQNQINPHFLYNTLHSIRYLNQIGDQKKTEQTIMALVRLLHGLFNKTVPEHTVGDEIRFLKDYILIQQVRYGNNFEVEFDCREDLHLCKLSRLILQPIVENAVFHGLSGYDEGGIIWISMERKQDMLEIQVKDNGIGFDKDKVKDRTEDIPTHGIGLENIRNRLKLRYGEGKYAFSIDSTPGHGTVVKLSIPFIERRDVDGNESDHCR